MVVDLEQDRIDLAVRLGADLGLLSHDKVTENIRDMTSGRGADVVLAGVGPTVQIAIDCVRRGECHIGW